MNFYERYARICAQRGRDSDNGRKFSWFLNVISVDTRL